MKGRLLTCAMLFFFVCSSSMADANQLDNFRRLIESERYTIRYEVYDSSTQKGIEKMTRDMSGAGYYSSIEKISEGTSNLPKYLVVRDMDAWYSEDTKPWQGYSEYIITYCHLGEGAEILDFQRSCFRGGKEKYSSIYSERDKNIVPRQAGAYDGNLPFGDPHFKYAITALFPEWTKNIFDGYHEVGSGTTEEGLTYYDLEPVQMYEDDEGEEQDWVSAIRYYFQGDKLVKISSATTFQTAGEKPEIERIIIYVQDISPLPDQKYLQLPEELKVVR